jgi:hypothetical protein
MFYPVQPSIIPGMPKKNCGTRGTSKIGYAGDGCPPEDPPATTDIYIRIPNFSWSFLGQSRTDVGTVSASHRSGPTCIFSSTRTETSI